MTKHRSSASRSSDLTARHRDAAATSPRRNVWTRVGLVLLGMAAAVAVAVLAWPRGAQAPTVPTPADMSALEPDVRALIEKQLSRISVAGDAREIAELAQMYEANELWAEARDTYELAVAREPSRSLWKLHLAICAREKGDAQRYQALLEQLAVEAPEQAAVHQRLGYVWLESDRVDDAARSLETAVRLAPKSPEALAGLADVRLRQNRLPEAIELATAALTQDRSYRVAHYLLGRAYQRQGRDAEAAAEMQQGQQGKVRFVRDGLTERNDRYATTVRARTTLGMRRLVAGDTRGAITLFEAAARAAPRDASLLNSLAGAYMQAGRVDDARRVLEQALKCDDRSSTTYTNLANWYLFQQRPEDAIGFARGAVERGPQVMSTHGVLVDALLRAKHLPEAREALTRAQQSFPNEPMFQSLEAQLQRLQP